MERLTIRNSDGAWDVPLRCEDDGVYIHSQEIIDRLAAYEDTGLEPEQCARYARADIEGRLLVLPCMGKDVTIERGGLSYKGDHWNPPELTAFAEDPTTRTGKRVALFNMREVKVALEAQIRAADG